MNRIIVFLKMLFVPAAALFIGVVFTGAYFSSNVAISGMKFQTGSWATPAPGHIVLNEAMVNPSNSGESGPMPDGEWVELFNNGGVPVDVAGWYIYDDTASNYFTVTAGKTNTGSTVIAAGGFLAVYRNIGPIFANTVDSVRIYDGPIATGNLIDSLTYSSTTNGMSWSRLPDAVGAWTDNHTPTPGDPNV